MIVCMHIWIYMTGIFLWKKHICLILFGFNAECLQAF